LQKKHIKVKIRFIIKLILLVTIIVISGACKKINQGSIVGKWRYINMYVNNSTKMEEVWEFTKSRNLYIYQKNLVSGEEILMMGSYKVVWMLDKTVVKVEGVNEGIWNVNWHIKKMDENALMLYSNVGGNYLLKEFEKIK